MKPIVSTDTVKQNIKETAVQAEEITMEPFTKNARDIPKEPELPCGGSFSGKFYLAKNMINSIIIMQ